MTMKGKDDGRSCEVDGNCRAIEVQNRIRRDGV